jgi:hypothetical protein
VIALISFLVLIAVFLTVARVAGVVLEATGMARSAAQFQARSALLGVGFTTLESEEITSHPVRRRVVLWLMTFGNAGIITGIGSFMIAFRDAPALQTLLRSGELAAGVTLLLISVHISAANRVVANLTRRALRRFTTLEIDNLTTLLQLEGRRAVVEIRAGRDSELAGCDLASFDLPARDITVLGIRRHDGSFVGSPGADTLVRCGDVLTAYGPNGPLSALARPRACRSRPPGRRPARR